MSLENYTKVNNIKSISLGKYISCDYTISSADSVGTFSNLGSGETLNFICVGYDHAGRYYLLADRNVQTLTNTALSEYDVSTGKLITIDDTKVYIKLLSKASWKNIYYSDIIEFSDEIWNYDEPFWTYEIPDTSTNGNQRYILSGENITQVSEVGVAHGFRPAMVIEFDDSPRGNPELHPAFTLVTDPAKLVPGTAISCEYTVDESGNIGIFNNLGNATKSVLPDIPTGTPDGSFYFICVGYDYNGYPKCIADRVIQSNISWNTINAAEYATTPGNDTVISDGTKNRKCQIRVPNTTPRRYVCLDEGNYGEWDAIITLQSLNGCTPGDNEVWNTKYTLSFTTAHIDMVSDTDLSDGSNIIVRGYQDTETKKIRPNVSESQAKFAVSNVSNVVGFRPVFIFTEIDGSSRGRAGASTPIYTFDMDTPVEIGMSIPCEYTAKSGQLGVFSKFGLATKDWILAEGEEEPDGSFNFIFVGYTPEGYPKLVADRNIQINISFQTLHNAGFTLTTGTQVKIDSSTYYMRLPGSSTSRFVTATDYGEWDAIISLMTNKYIETPSDPKIWNCGNNKSWTMNYISYINETTLGTDNNCIIRGSQNTRFDINDEQYTKQGYQLANYVGKPVGFRPVLIVVPRDGKYRFLYSSGRSFGMFNPFN